MIYRVVYTLKLPPAEVTGSHHGRTAQSIDSTEQRNFVLIRIVESINDPRIDPVITKATLTHVVLLNKLTGNILQIKVCLIVAAGIKAHRIGIIEAEILHWLTGIVFHMTGLDYFENVFWTLIVVVCHVL